MQKVLPFSLEFDNKEDSLTALAGLPLICELWKRLNLDYKIKNLFSLKSNGYSENEMLKALVCLVISNGSCIDDIERLNKDQALKKLIKVEQFPSPSTLRRFLKYFHTHHDTVVGKSFVPKENSNLDNLGFVCRRIVSQAIERSGLETVTVENDATYIDSHKEEAQIGYKGQGYMPTVAAIAELDMVLHEEFRDANVTPSFGIQEFFKSSLRSLPSSVKHIQTRLDGAYYQYDFMEFLRKKKITYPITAKKSDSFLKFIEAIKEKDWKVLKDKNDFDTGKDYAEMYWMSAGGTRETMKERRQRYLITRQRVFQPSFENCETEIDEKEKRSSRYQVIVTNDETKACDELIHWHHKKGGHIEKIHDRVKNDLAGGTMPSGEFGANAAWYRINCLAWNLIRILQIEAMPKNLKTCYLKKLRFWLFNIAGKVIETGHQLILKLSGCRETFQIYQRAREKIAALEVPS